jgi:hypothetical protein
MSSIKTFTAWINEARRPEWKDSDAPDANGRFRDLGIKALAKWLISSRKGDMRKITGSLNQQIVFNRGDNPAYAKKMEKVREEVKRQLKKNEGFDPEQWDQIQKQHIDKRRLEDLGLADSALNAVEDLIQRRRWKWSKSADGSLNIELVRWEAESTYLSRMGARHQKKYPNYYNFTVSDYGAEPGTLRILWHSSKDPVREESIDSSDPWKVVQKIDQLFSERRVD